MLVLLQPVIDTDVVALPAAKTSTAAIKGETFLGDMIENDILVGTAGDDVMSGFGGDDRMSGGGGNDSMSGGFGDDVLKGRSGNDVIYGNEGWDVIEAGGGDDFASGGEGNDIILGGAGNDTLSGADGDDFLDGGAGNDVIAGDLSDGKNRADVADGGTGRDTLTFARCSAGVFVDLSYGSDLLGNVDAAAIDVNDVLIVNMENVTGSALNDYLAGNDAANGLTGLDGDDMLYGRRGADKLTGGLGADTFIYAGVGEGRDTIRDYEQGIDHILLSSEAFGGIDQTNLLASFQRSKSGMADHPGPKLVLQTEGEGAGNLYYFADGNTPASGKLIASLHFSSDTGLTNFGLTDFLFV